MQYVWVVATSLLLVTLLANVIVVQYARGVVRTALDDGVRAGARVTGPPAAAEARCEETAAQVRRDLLGGRLGETVEVDCTPGPAEMRATATATFPSWLPLLPDWPVSAAAVAVQERAP